MLDTTQEAGDITALIFAFENCGTQREISCQGSQGSAKSVPPIRSQVCQIVVCTLVCRMLSYPQEKNEIKQWE